MKNGKEGAEFKEKFGKSGGETTKKGSFSKMGAKMAKPTGGKKSKHK